MDASIERCTLNRKKVCGRFGTSRLFLLPTFICYNFGVNVFWSSHHPRRPTCPSADSILRPTSPQLRLPQGLFSGLVSASDGSEPGSAAVGAVLSNAIHPGGERWNVLSAATTAQGPRPRFCEPLGLRRPPRPLHDPYSEAAAPIDKPALPSPISHLPAMSLISILAKAEHGKEDCPRIQRCPAFQLSTLIERAPS